MVVVVAVLSSSASASPDKHFYRILQQAIEEAQAKGPTTEAKLVALWRSEMTKFGDGACRCARLLGFVEVDGRYVEKRALCNQGVVEDLMIAFMPELLRLPGNYAAWNEALQNTEADASAKGEELATRFLAANVKAKEQAEVRRRSGRCITGGEDR